MRDRAPSRGAWTCAAFFSALSITACGVREAPSSLTSVASAAEADVTPGTYLDSAAGFAPVSAVATHSNPHDATCDAGLTAFKNTVFPLVRNHCHECHDGTGNGPSTGPAFAVPDPVQAYDQVKARTDFSNIPQSIFVVTGGNRHCLSRGGKPDCGASHDDVLAAVNAWWTQGEQTCNELGTLVTTALTLPATLPTKDQGFQTLKWDLGTIDPTLKGTVFEVDAQHFATPTASTKGAYRFREPRVATATSPIFVKGIKLAVNGAYDVRANTYTTVRQTVEPALMPTDGAALLPFPALSPFTLIVLQDKPSGDTLEVAFEHLNVSTPVACKAMAKFQPIADLLAARNCYACHGGGPDQQPGTAPARQRLPLTGDLTAICGQALQRMDRFNPSGSVFISYPLRGSNEHPRVIPQTNEIEPAWSEWVAAELAQ